MQSAFIRKNMWSGFTHHPSQLCNLPLFIRICGLVLLITRVIAEQSAFIYKNPWSGAFNINDSTLCSLIDFSSRENSVTVSDLQKENPEICGHNKRVQMLCCKHFRILQQRHLLSSGQC